MGNEGARIAQESDSRTRAAEADGYADRATPEHELRHDPLPVGSISPFAHPAPALQPLRRAIAQRLQRSHGNQAVMRLIQRQTPGLARQNSQPMPAAPEAVQRAAWTAQDTTTKGTVSAELQAGLTAAVASPDAAPAPLPAWIRSRVKRALDYDNELAAELAQVPTKVNAAWNKLKPAAKAANVEATWKTNRQAVEENKVRTSWSSKLNQQTTNREGEFKWNEPFANTDGFLPGVAGAGGYREYYAEPDPGSDPAQGFWGENRMLHKVSGPDHRDKWWVTTDHYTSFRLVADV